MNRMHHWICSSNRWQRTLAKEVFPRVLDGIALGDNVLEVGPGPGLTTDLLIGMDTINTWSLRLMHWGDTLVPIDPAQLEPRLKRSGFADVLIETEKGAFRFSARRPV